MQKLSGGSVAAEQLVRQNPPRTRFPMTSLSQIEAQSPEWRQRRAIAIELLQIQSKI
jgi:hypothetical protein